MVTRNINTSLRVSWQPDSTHLAVEGAVDAITGLPVELDTYELATSQRTQVGCALTANQVAYASSWSPDGQWLTYLSNQNSAAALALYLAPPTGNGSCDLAISGVSASSPVYDYQWSPTIDTLLYGTSPQASGTPGALYSVVTTAGGASAPIQIADGVCVPTSTTSPECMTFAWSPDGNRFAYTAEDSSSKTSLFVAAPSQTNGGIHVTDASIVRVLSFSWSSNSVHVALLGATDSTWNLYTARFDGGAPIRVSPAVLPASLYSTAYAAQYGW